MYKRSYYIGIAAYMVLLLLSILFYKERIISPDTSFLMFHIIKNGTFHIESYRFGEIFDQIWPILARRSALSMNVIMMSYSAGYIIYNIICYVLCGSALKRYDLALVILFINVLFVTDTFYWVPAELPQGMVLLMLLYAIVSNQQMNTTRPLTWGMILLILMTLAFFHPLVLFAVLFSLVFFIDRSDLVVDKKLLRITGGLFFSAVLLKGVFFRTPYEQHSMSGVKNFVKLFPNYLTLYSNERFLTNCVTKYYWLPLLLVGTVAAYVRNKAWMKMLLVMVFFFGYLLLVNVSFPTAGTPVFYMERLYLPLGIFIVLPFVFDVLPLLEKKKLALPLVLLIVLSGCIRIYAAHGTYSSRLGYERRQIDKYADRKVIVKAERSDIDTLQMLWSNPYEFALLSSCEQGKTASIIIDEHPEERGWAADQKNSLIVNWNFYKYSELPGQYFHFTDTVSGYAILNVKP